MQTLLDILKRAGGWNPGLYLKIENAPYMALVIEATDESGPSGLPAISIAHYGEQNGDLMRDPEMCFELGFAEGPHLDPFYFRNDYIGLEQWSRTIERGHYVPRDRMPALVIYGMTGMGALSPIPRQTYSILNDPNLLYPTKRKMYWWESNSATTKIRVTTARVICTLSPQRRRLEIGCCLHCEEGRLRSDRILQIMYRLMQDPRTASTIMGMRMAS
jgi:hypothetical protein